MKKDLEELEQFFGAQAEAFPGKVSYLYRDMGEPVRSFFQASSQKVVSASTIKVPVMLCLFDKMQKEGIALDQLLTVKNSQILSDSLVFEYGEREASLHELTVWMIENSDNTATNVLMDYLGFPGMNAFFQRMGLSETCAERIMLDFEAVKQGYNNYISPEDFYTCMKFIYEKKKSDPLYETGWNILKHNRDHGDLMRYLYEEPACAHKTGGLDGIEHDAGVFETAYGTYFLGIFLSEFQAGQEMETEAMKLIGRLSRKTFDFYKENADR